MTCYLAGPMTGVPLNNQPAFEAAAATLRRQGHVVLNPHELVPPDTRQWGIALRAALTAMLRPDCRSIVLLPGWPTSHGAVLEHHVAVQLGYDVYCYRDGEAVQL